MPGLSEVPIPTVSLERFRAVLGPDYAEVERAIERAARLLSGRVIWHVNSTARGGGVAELLESLLAYARSAGVDTRWLTISGEADFFRVTKRIHNHLHGVPGDGGELAREERTVYERALSSSARELASRVGDRDIVFLHDPQTAGLTHVLRSNAGHVIWRCHVGIDRPNRLARGAWGFLRPYVVEADAYVFSRQAFVWDGLEQEKLWIVAPSIDAFSAKNQELHPGTVRGILSQTGIAERGGGEAVFVRRDGTVGRVAAAADLDHDRPIPGAAPLIMQISRWDRLKDPSGVLESFAERSRRSDAHLLLAGPSVAGVADDPEQAEVLAEIREQREGLAAEIRARVHLACLPMDDVEENAAIVNALQRRADVVIQKSLAEGFGLTVAEAMWKARPVVASRVGGIQDQIVDGHSGVLIEPADLDAAGAAVDRLLGDPTGAGVMGIAARDRVRSSFLGTRHLIQYVELLETLVSRE